MNRFLIKSGLVRTFFILASFLAIFALVFPFQAALAQTTSGSSDTAAQQAALQAQYNTLQQQIAEEQALVDTTKAKASSLQGDVSYLNAQIKAAQLSIQQKTIAIQQLSEQINEKTSAINTLEGRIAQGKDSLAELIRQTNVLDNYSLVEVLLSNQNLSDAFDDLDLFTSINRAMENDFTEIRTVQAATEDEKTQLAQKQNSETDAKQAIVTQKAAITTTQNQKQQLLTQTKGEEAAYQAVVAQKQAEAAKILAALFDLRDAKGIAFGDALQYADVASVKTGVDPALILAILKQESDLGANQGSCLVTNITTGDGVGKNTGTAFQKVMKAPRDTVPFQSITSRLGHNWQTQVVSCPPGYTYTANRGYGGGMGPSQFIPSTWELFKARIGAAVGVSADQADPWNPQDAIMATALYMADLGANSKSYTAEENAACKYYSGRSCDNKKPANIFYGQEVMQSVASIQANIQVINDSKAQSGR